MQNQKHQSKKSTKDFLANLKKVHKVPRPNQLKVMEIFPKDDAHMVQGPTGTGKTGLGYSFLKTHCGDTGNGFYLCPGKTLVDQVVVKYPEIMPMYGRNEYPCLYYEGDYKADEVPCSLLKECPHRVNLETGQTFEEGAKPCPYFQAKYQSRQSKLVACTNQYYFFEALSRGKENLPEALVVDELHKFADSIRGMMKYKITDSNLEEFWELLSSIDCRSEARHVREFSDTMIRIIRQYESGRKTTLISDDDLKEMLKILLKLKRSNIDDKIKKAISTGKINYKTDREILKALDEFTGSLYKYVKSLEFALETKEHKPMTYVFGFWDKELVPGKKAQYTLTISSYSISGLTKNNLLPEKRLAMSATMGADSEIISMETGFTGMFTDLESDFPIENTFIFMPDDVPDLSEKGSRRNDKNRTIRQMLRAVKNASEKHIRSLIIVVSEKERAQCMAFALEEGVHAVSYDENTKPRDAVKKFREGIGAVLIGTEAQYGEGIDLPDGVAEFTFYLRPGYPSPSDPQAQFEERRLGNRRWALWTWRVVNKMLQVRGRTIRSISDKGCIFLMSKQFKRFTFGGLPKWLQPAYKTGITFEQAVEQGIKFMKKK